MDKKTEAVSYCCNTCKYFGQHYIFAQDKFLAVNCHHCVCPSMPFKTRNCAFPLKESCKYWEERAGEEEKQRKITDMLLNVEELLQRIESLIIYG